MARLLYSRAKEEGLSVVLDGYHGDAVVSHGTAWLAELVARLRLWRFLRELGPLAQGESRARALWLLGLRPLLREYRDEIRMASPPAFVQGPLFALVAPLARALGYRTWYPEYSPSEGRP